MTLKSLPSLSHCGLDVGDTVRFVKCWWWVIFLILGTNSLMICTYCACWVWQSELKWYGCWLFSLHIAMNKESVMIKLSVFIWLQKSPMLWTNCETLFSLVMNKKLSPLSLGVCSSIEITSCHIVWLLQSLWRTIFQNFLILYYRSARHLLLWGHTLSHTLPGHDCRHSGITSFEFKNNPPCCFLCKVNHMRKKLKDQTYR